MLSLIWTAGILLWFGWTGEGIGFVGWWLLFTFALQDLYSFLREMDDA